MGKVIKLSGHRVFEERNRIKEMYKDCTLRIKDDELVHCVEFPSECNTCNVLKSYKELSPILTKYKCEERF